MKEHLQDLKIGGRPMTKLELANKEIKRLNVELERLIIQLELYKDNQIYLNNQLEQKDKIIKEVREYIQNCGCDDKAIDYIENILDKVEENK